MRTATASSGWSVSTARLPILRRCDSPKVEFMLSSILGRNQLERKTGAQRSIAAARFDRRLIVERLGLEFALARRRAESALRERQERLAIGRDVQPDRMFASSRSSVMPSRNG